MIDTPELSPAKKERAPKGLYCPQCNGRNLRVRYGRKGPPGRYTRYRKCRDCDCKFKTREIMMIYTDPDPAAS